MVTVDKGKIYKHCVFGESPYAVDLSVEGGMEQVPVV